MAQAAAGGRVVPFADRCSRRLVRLRHVRILQIGIEISSDSVTLARRWSASSPATGDETGKALSNFEVAQPRDRYRPLDQRLRRADSDGDESPGYASPAGSGEYRFTSRSPIGWSIVAAPARRRTQQFRADSPWDPAVVVRAVAERVLNHEASLRHAHCRAPGERCPQAAAQLLAAMTADEPAPRMLRARAS